MTTPGLAVVTPLPPVWSGVADYSSRLLPHLSERWDVSVVIGDSDPEPLGVPDEVRVFRLQDWRWARPTMAAQRMLLCLGNSAYHLHMPDLASRHGGVALAHDVRMTAFECLRATQSTDRFALSSAVWARHGPELGREVRAMEERAPLSEIFGEVRARLEEANALLLSSAVGGADVVCVHSHLAARLARLELVDLGLPVVTVPFGFPVPRSGSRSPVEGRIAAFGMVEPEKQPLLLVEALALVRHKVPEATLRLVGPLGGGMEEMLRTTTVRLGLSEAVSWTDRVDDDEYRRELAGAEVAVQLRAVVNGEASAAVADCLAAGIPTVVTAIGAHAELPSGTVRHVPAGATPYQVAEVLQNLLCDQGLRASMVRAGRRHARNSSFARAAQALSDVLEEAPAIRA